jgi:hypothetical protein
LYHHFSLFLLSFLGSAFFMKVRARDREREKLISHRFIDSNSSADMSRIKFAHHDEAFFHGSKNRLIIAKIRDLKLIQRKIPLDNKVIILYLDFCRRYHKKMAIRFSRPAG